MNYIPYHVHTELSLLDSCTNFQDYIDFCVNNKIKAICFSEHGNIYQHIAKHMACNTAGIKYLHGCEVYVTKTLKENIRDNYHTILISKNYEGYQELNSLLELSTHEDHFYYKNRISIEEFLNISDNIIKISACLASPLNHKEEIENPDLYEKMCKKYDYYEIQYHNVKDQIEYNKYLYELSQKFNKPLIVGTDTHSINKYKAECRKILMKAKKINYTNEDEFDLTMKTYDELVLEFEKQKSLPMSVILQAIENTNLLYEQCEDLPLDTSIKYPIVSDNDEKDLQEFINKKYKEKIDLGIIKPDKRYIENIKEEFRVFKKIGMLGFMLFMGQMCSWCRENNIATGFCRGSVGGSTIAYIIDITDVNPLQWDTVFSRFANEDREEVGDIDLDFVPEEREKVYNYIINRFGKEKTGYILSLGTISEKATIDEIGRALEIPLDEVKTIKEEYSSNPENTRKKYPDLFYYFDGLLNTTVSQGFHPAGIVASPVNLIKDYGMFYKDGMEILTIDMEEIHEIGLVKYDILGLKNIGIIKDCCELAGIKYPRSNEINWEDEKVWEDINCSGVGIFQFESSYGFDSLKRFNCHKVNDLSLVNACIRPSGASYRDKLLTHQINKNPSEIIDKLLERNFGFLTFQEDTIAFLQKICGLSGSEADNIRRAIGRKQKDRLEKALPKILEGYCSKSDKPRDVAEKEAMEFLQIIEDSADYQFGYNHSTGYSMIGYLCAYLRYYYPLEFVCAYLNNASNDDDIAQGTDLAKIKKIKILPIKFGKSRAKYFMDKQNNVIYKGIGSVKFLNNDVAEELYKLSKNKYETFIDLLIDIKNKTSLNSRQLDILIKLDFFADFGNSKELLNIVEMAEQFKFGEIKTMKKEKLEGSYALDIVKKYATDTGKTGKLLKNYTILDCKSILRECEEYIKSLNIEDIDLRNKIINQQEYLGYISATEKPEDRPILFIKKVQPLKRKKDGKQFGYGILTQSIGSGIISYFTIINKTFKECGELKKNDIIQCLDYDVRNGYYTLKKYFIKI